MIKYRLQQGLKMGICNQSYPRWRQWMGLSSGHWCFPANLRWPSVRNCKFVTSPTNQSLWTSMFWRGVRRAKGGIGDTQLTLWKDVNNNKVCISCSSPETTAFDQDMLFIGSPPLYGRGCPGGPSQLFSTLFGWPCLCPSQKRWDKGASAWYPLTLTFSLPTSPCVLTRCFC